MGIIPYSVCLDYSNGYIVIKWQVLPPGPFHNRYNACSYQQQLWGYIKNSVESKYFSWGVQWGPNLYYRNLNYKLEEKTIRQELIRVNPLQHWKIINSQTRRRQHCHCSLPLLCLQRDTLKDKPESELESLVSLLCFIRQMHYSFSVIKRSN